MIPTQTPPAAAPNLTRATVEKRGQHEVSGSERSQLASQIGEIVNDRRRRATDLQAQFENAEEQVEALRGLAAVTREYYDTFGEKLQPKLTELIETAEAAAAELDTLCRDASRIVRRWQQGRLTMGVAGPPRMGKSTLLQSITGLSNDVLPAGDGPPLTGARSRIDSSSGPQTATVHFLRRDQFLGSVIGSYYHELNLGSTPSWAAFDAGLPKGDDLKPAEHAIFDELSRTWSARREYASSFDSEPRSISLGEVTQYVSQHGSSLFHAVEQVRIRTEFPAIDSTDVSVVDLPGLGEIARGHEEKLTETLQTEVDAVFYLKRPSHHGDDWSYADNKVVGLVDDAIPEVELRDSMFVVLNRVQNEAGRGQESVIEGIRGKLQSKYADITIIEADVSNADQVKERILLPTLETLASRLPELDQVAANRLTERRAPLLEAVESAYSDLVESFSRDEPDIQSKFVSLRDAFIKDLRVSLHDLLREYHPAPSLGSRSSIVDQTRHDYLVACEDAWEAARNGFAESVVVGELVRSKKHKAVWEAVLEDEMSRGRSSFTHRLQSELEQRLRSLLNTVRTKTLSRLHETPLGHILNEGDATTALHCLAEAAPDESATIAAGLGYLAEFRVGYYDVLHPQIRRQMTALDIESDGGRAIREQLDLRNDLSTENEARKVRGFLLMQYDEATTRAFEALRDFADNLEWAVFATLEEFKDRLVRTDGNDREWFHLLYTRRTQVWPAEYAAIQAYEEAENAIRAAGSRAQLASSK